MFASEKKDNLTTFYGVKNNSETTSKFRDAKIALNSWLKEASSKYNAKVKVKFYDSNDFMYEEFKNDELDVITVDLLFYFKNETEIKNNSSHIWSMKMSEKTFDEYYLISRKSKNLDGFSDLKNRTLAIKKSDSNSKIWLDKESYLINKKISTKLLKELKLENKESTVILDVFFKKYDYGIVTKEAWDFLSEFNPAIKKKVKIISKSQDIFLPFIGFISKDASSNSVDVFFKLTEDFKAYIIKNSINFKSNTYDSLLNLDNDSLYILREYYNEYFELEKKYK
jgi:ABC-type phosphate/phosphonate transport system substrate-binding protein